ncbi:MAG: signal peptidase [Frankiales bacterium]|nr:signal peptidase [Frankiales bacterium]
MTEDTTVVAAQKPSQTKKPRSFLAELPFLVVIAFVLALLIKTFLVQAFYIPSESMQNTLQVGDRVLVNKLPYHWREPHRGEIVVFNGLDSFDDGVTFTQPTNPVSKALRKLSSTIGLGAPNERDYIKRVIGVPGDRVMCCDNDGNVVVSTKDGKTFSLHETFLFENDHKKFCEASETSDSAQCPAGSLGVLVPKGRLWVMGDHRGNSSDSRYHITDANHGTVPENKVVGKAFTVIYPLDRFGWLGVPGTFDKLAAPQLPLLGGFVGALPIAALRRRRLRAR